MILKMGKLSCFEIFLDNAGSTCLAGGEVTGSVVIETVKDLQVQELTIEMDGRAEVFCVDVSKMAVSEVHPEIVMPHADEEVYISEVVVLFRGEGNDPLRKGKHKFRFRFQIPSCCPNSYEGEFGYVRYILKSRLTNYWEEETVTRPVRVTSRLDLNFVDDANSQVEKSDEMTVCSLFSQEGLCHSALRLDRQGYVPGEIIPLSLVVHNNTTKQVIVSLELRMLSEYRCQSITHTQTNRLQIIKYPKVAAKTTFEQREHKLRVPTCPPSHLHGCNIIDITYQVVLKIKPGRISLKRLHVAVDITIGTVPLRRGSLITALAGSLPIDHHWITPPTYDEVMASDTKTIKQLIAQNKSETPDLTSLPDYAQLRARANTDSSIVRLQRR